MSDRSPCDHEGLRRHCVSRPAHDYFRRFLNQYRDLPAHYVSRRPEVYFAQRRACLRRDHARGRRRPRARHLATQPTTQPFLFCFVALFLAPRRARSTMPLALARFVAAHSLPIANAHVRRKPSAADPARALAHRRQRRLPTSSSPPTPDLTGTRPRRVRSREHPTGSPSTQAARAGSVFTSTPGSILASAEGTTSAVAR